MGRSNSTNKEAIGLKKVGSSTGFSVGDPIYETSSGTGKVPDSYVSTATFATNGPLRLQGGGSSGYSTFCTNHVIDKAGVGGGNYIYKLANGNLCYAYGKTSGTRQTTQENYDIYFKVEQQDGTSVVAETQVSTTQWDAGSCSAAIAVTQLSGGNVVICWPAGGAGKLHWRIMNPTNGSAVTSENNLGSTVVQADYGFLHLVPNNAGGWLTLCCGTSSTTPEYFIQDSSDSTVLTATNLFNISTSTNLNSVGAILRHDGNFLLHSYVSGGLQVRVINGTTGATIQDSSQNSLTGNPAYGCGATIDSNNDILLFGNISGNLQLWKVESSSNSLSSTVVNLFSVSEFSYGNWTSSWQAVEVYTLPGTDNHIVWCNQSSGTAPNSFHYYDSTGNRLADFQEVGGAQYTDGAKCSYFCEVGDKLRYYTTVTYSQRFPDNLSEAMFYYQIDPSLYSVLGGSSVTGSLGTASGVSTGAYVESGSTVKGASFRPASSGALQSVQALTQNEATQSFAETELFTTSLNTYDVCPLDNGGFAVMWMSGSNVYVRIYDVNGAQASETTISTTAYNVNPAHCAITQLSNGKIVFVYSSGSGYAFQCRDADMNVTTAEMPLPTTQTVNNNGQYYGCAIGALMTEAQDEWVLLYTASSMSNSTYIEHYDDTGTSLFTANAGGSPYQNYASYNRQICPLANGNYFYAFSNSYQNNITSFLARRESRTSYRVNCYQDPYGNNSYLGNHKAGWTNYGGNLGAGWVNHSSSTNAVISTTPGNMLSSSYYTKTFNSTSTTNQWKELGVSASGTIQALNLYNQNNLYVYTSSNWRSVNALYNFSNVRASSAQRFNVSTIPWKGNEMLYFYTDGGSFSAGLYCVGIRAYDEQINIGYDSLTSTSEGADLASNRAAFLGVAVSDCPAGGSGDVQTKGTVSLASTYKDASAESFDFVSRSTDGKSGSQSGRTVTIKES